MGWVAGVTASLRGRVAVVTGGGSGIGAATVRRLAREGARTVVLDVAPAGSETDADAAIVCDVTDARAVVETAARVGRDAGPARVLVNAAGVAPVGNALECTVADWERAFAVNVTGTWLTCRAFLDAMTAAGGGAIVNIASGAALRPTPGMAAYSASKAAVVALTRSIALDFAARGVRANALCPGAVDTPLHRATAAARAERGHVVATAAGAAPYVASTEEMADHVLTLARPESGSLTGVALAADGGRVMH